MSSTEAAVALTTGSPRSHTRDVGAFTVVEAWFPPDLVLPAHLHDRASLVVMLEGSFDLHFARRSYACPPATVVTEPVDEKHGNRFGRQGAHVLVLQPDPARCEALRPCAPLFDRVLHTRHGGISSLAWRMAYEVRTPDAISTLALQGLGLEMMAAAARLQAPRRTRPPAWLARVEEQLRDAYLHEIDVDDLARTAGVHPVHLARAFRRYHHTSIGAFVRRLRLDWALQQLATGTASIAEIALAAGFSDQSHFTRHFRRYTGLTPGRYRRSVRA